MRINTDLRQILSLNEASHIGIVVKDIEKAVTNYLNIFGISFPKVFIPEYFKIIYRGKPGNFRIKIAQGTIGKLYLGLIQVLEGESIYSEFLRNEGEGLHHLGFDVENLEERIKVLEGLGIGVLQWGERTGVRFAYMDTEKIVGVIFQFVEREIKMGG